MPGWFIHMEAAKVAIDRLRAGDVPPNFPGGPQHAKELGEIAHKWRNYLALGAIGPDIFFLLPDFKSETGNVLLHFVDWVRDVYEVIDEQFLSKWEKWFGPVSSGNGQILNNLTGGVLAEIGQAFQELSKALQDAIFDLIIKLWDWFGLLTSGVPQGFKETAFFWSDIFHYRKTYEFPRQLFADADTDQKKAFAMGWISHCAADVTGHPFVNAKCGGPYRLHWQRHHVIENHMDALVYDSEHHGVEPYGEMATSALHFRVAFRKRNDAPYNGAEDAPAYDYFTGFPFYDSSPGGDFQREQLWDLDSGDMPDDLCKHVIETMRKVFGDDHGVNPPVAEVPRILTDDPAQFRDGDSGRPSMKTLQDTFWTLYHYIKFTATDGYSPRRPPPPDFIDPSTFNPPPFPGSDAGVGDDPARGDDPGGGDSFNFLDLLFALFAFIIWIGEFGVWLATLPAQVIAEMTSYPARAVLYETVVVPAWSLYLAARNPLVMAGFLVPRTEEISRGLVELGISPEGALQQLAAALASPTGTAAAIPFDEKSGRAAGSAFGVDRAFPRAIIEDAPSTIASAIGFLKPDLFCGNPQQPSEFLAPWRYPEKNQAGARNGWEAPRTHPGPYTQGQDARVLMNHAPGSDVARAEFEKAPTPTDTDHVCDSHLGAGRHLGDPVDYSVYLIGRLTNGDHVPDFNLDADRGYGYRSWDWNRKKEPIWTAIAGEPKFDFPEPCTVPEGFCEGTNAAKYDASTNLAIHYKDQADPGCGGATKVTPEQIKQAGMRPDGKEG